MRDRIDPALLNSALGGLRRAQADRRIAQAPVGRSVNPGAYNPDAIYPPPRPDSDPAPWPDPEADHVD